MKIAKADSVRRNQCEFSIKLLDLIEDHLLHLSMTAILAAMTDIIARELTRSLMKEK